MGAPQSVTYNDFFYNMLQAGEVAEITIFPGEDLENRAIILLRQGAMYKVRILFISSFFLDNYIQNTLSSLINEHALLF